ncbi:hypothetical protein PoB_005499400 [Plakobranchus ocellatus]|uniref:RAG1 importin-binding domain-containing protein n=1 Tax=Plakobranchus ocellatus TaxID=259542 RepID=A0AAV4C7G5_9GAST|nr:hypothetical protein PoB_005499400 [Plakobranchus ocellatus]
MEHSLDSHIEKLEDLCRLCGNRVLSVAERRTNRRKLRCANFTANILMVFMISVQRDKDNVHPKFMCYKCSKIIINVKKRGGLETLRNAQMRASETDKMWTECDTNVSSSECAVCVQFSNSCLGNRQLKQAKNRFNTCSTINLQRHYN